MGQFKKMAVLKFYFNDSIHTYIICFQIHSTIRKVNCVVVPSDLNIPLHV